MNRLAGEPELIRKGFQMTGITAAVVLEERRLEDTEQQQQRRTVVKTPTEKGVGTGSIGDIRAYFARLQAMLSSNRSYAALRLAMPDDLPPFEATPPTDTTYESCRQMAYRHHFSLALRAWTQLL